MIGLWLLWILGGCPKPHTPPQGPEGDGEETIVTAAEARQGRLIGTGSWRDPEGLVLYVPPGWLGRTGVPGSPLALLLEHEGTGVFFELRVTSASEPRPLPVRDGCTPMFEDAGAYRAIPLLSPSSSSTCMPEDGADFTVQRWEGVYEERRITVDVRYPRGELVRGRLVVQELLSRLTHD